MGRIFCLMGKSSSGKDTIYRALTEDRGFPLKRMVPYTTRPIRDGEQEGREYHFITEQELTRLEKEGRIVELRSYDTVHGIWKYMTVCEEEMDLDRYSWLVIGTLESWHALRLYFGKEKLVPVYIEVEDGLRLERALKREQRQKKPEYEEMCRRFLADAEDFSEERLREEEITRRFQNENIDSCIKEIKLFIQEEMRYN